jgi:hypothetical protein
MPIEFPCPQCGRTLRTPDGSAGKRAKCPSCETVTSIPEASGSDFPAASGVAGDNPFAGLSDEGRSAGNPFAESASRPTPGGFDDPTNPYASPQTGSYAETAAPAGTLQQSKIDFGEVLAVTWSIFKENVGNLVLLALIFIGMIIGLYILIFLGALVGAAVGATMGQGVFIMIGAIAGGVVMGIGSLFAVGWLFAGATKYLLAVARGQHAPLSEVFNGQHYMLRMTGYLFITQILIVQGLTLIGLAPGFFQDDQVMQIIGQYIGQIIGGVISGFLFVLGGYFIVDRDVGVFESLSMSIRYLNGNRLVLFAIYLVVGIVGGLFLMVTCGFGMLFYVPYYMLLMTITYLMATGQMVRR